MQKINVDLTDSDDVEKSYFTAQNLQLGTDNAIKACQINDMTLALPQSQAEYDNLKQIWKMFKKDKVTQWRDEAAIAGYLSSKTNTWVDSGDKYIIAWSKGEPNNIKGNEFCMFLNFKNEVTAKDGTCSGYEKSFICEFTKNRQRSISVDENEISRFFQELSDASIEQHVVLYVNHPSVEASLIDAKLLCKTFGLEFFAKDVDDTDLKNSSILNKFVCYKIKDLSNFNLNHLI